MNMQVSRLGVALMGALVLSMGCGGEKEATTVSTRLTVPVTRGNLIIRAEATGNIEPVRSVEVKSKASGEVLKLHHDVGDQVTRGTLLAEIDPRDVQNNYNQVQADLEVAQARMEISRTQLDRSQQLLDADIITTQEHENARLDFANAQTALLRAQTNFELAQLQLQDVRITAPMDGTIIQKSVEEGMVIQSASQNVSGGTALFVMADLAQMQVRTLVDETDMGRLRAGMGADVSVEAYQDRTFDGLIEKIEPQAVVEQNVTMFPVIVSLDNSSGLLRPGMNADVDIFIDEARNVLLVPNVAIVRAQNVGPAALALGLDIDNLDLSVFMAAGGGSGRPGGRGGNGGGGFTGRNGGTGGTGGGRRGGGNLDPEAAARFQQMRAQAEGGAISQDSLRAAMQSMRSQQGAAPGGSTQMAAADGEGASQSYDTQPGAVFAIVNGKPEPRLIQIGLGDWDNTAVTGDIQEGDLLAVVSAAQLQAQQQEYLDRMSSRMGGSNPFGGNIPNGGNFRGGGGGGRRGGF